MQKGLQNNCGPMLSDKMGSQITVECEEVESNLFVSKQTWGLFSFRLRFAGPTASLRWLCGLSWHALWWGERAKTFLYQPQAKTFQLPFTYFFDGRQPEVGYFTLRPQDVSRWGSRSGWVKSRSVGGVGLRLGQPKRQVWQKNKLNLPDLKNIRLVQHATLSHPPRQAFLTGFY